MNKSIFFGALTVAGLAAGAAAAGTLDDVKARGKLNCGVSTGLVGFAAPDANGNWDGPVEFRKDTKTLFTKPFKVDVPTMRAEWQTKQPQWRK